MKTIIILISLIFYVNFIQGQTIDLQEDKFFVNIETEDCTIQLDPESCFTGAYDLTINDDGFWKTPGDYTFSYTNNHHIYIALPDGECTFDKVSPRSSTIEYTIIGSTNGSIENNESWGCTVNLSWYYCDNGTRTLGGINNRKLIIPQIFKIIGESYYWKLITMDQEKIIIENKAEINLSTLPKLKSAELYSFKFTSKKLNFNNSLTNFLSK
ncbi:hypothetical protein EI427_23460 [Flammeovirga pectinis]|uniref:Uncharacterized protein n=1 Tax=Flammeovirga pectinis TaxID=2494373 RepID=A0A3Q9FR55_9BACT|nr:hypothetical protein [Flammeovirga pectinis]AZQ65174.1 hypothetical protein EI427_23460 [Flammeovirga pectinis]